METLQLPLPKTLTTKQKILAATVLLGAFLALCTGVALNKSPLEELAIDKVNTQLEWHTLDAERAELYAQIAEIETKMKDKEAQGADIDAKIAGLLSFTQETR